MSWSNAQQQQLETLITKIGLDRDKGLNYLEKHRHYTANQCELELIALRARELGMSYGKFVSLNNFVFVHNNVASETKKEALV